jgi:hypothetical protein
MFGTKSSWERKNESGFNDHREFYVSSMLCVLLILLAMCTGLYYLCLHCRLFRLLPASMTVEFVFWGLVIDCCLIYELIKYSKMKRNALLFRGRNWVSVYINCTQIALNFLSYNAVLLQIFQTNCFPRSQKIAQ